jgi:hypothetical protein
MCELGVYPTNMDPQNKPCNPLGYCDSSLNLYTVEAVKAHFSKSSDYCNPIRICDDLIK